MGNAIMSGLRQDTTLAAVIAFGGMLAASSHIQAATSDQTINKLQRQLELRDAVIRDLTRRVEELERKIGQAGAESRPPKVAATTPQSSPKPEPPPAVPAKPRLTPASESEPSAPGRVTATEEEAERALERTLVATGVLLLPFGRAEIEPGFNYIRRDDSMANIGDLVLADQRVRRNEYQSSLGARFGLPFDAQLEVGLPFNVVAEERRINLGGAGRLATSETGSGIGDLSVGLAKTVLRERKKKWWPDLITRFTWDTPTGQTQDHDVVLGAGFSEILGQLVASKKQDPLVFFASTSYQKTFEHKNIEPGDAIGFELGAYLAASPDTSLQFSLAQTFVDDIKQGGKVIKDSDAVLGVLNLGASSILGHGVLINTVFGIGVTEDAPDYSVTVSLPIQFGAHRNRNY